MSDNNQDVINAEQVQPNNNKKVTTQDIKRFVLDKLYGYVNSSKKTNNKNIILVVIDELQEAKKNIDIEMILHKLDVLKSYCKRYGEHSARLNKLLNEMYIQIIKRDDFLKRGDSEILDNHIGEKVVLEGKPKALSNEERNYMVNLPNPYNNVSTNAIHLPDQKINRIDMKKLSIVYVSGGDTNPYGHAILKLGDHGYIQINTLYGYPQYIKNDEEFGAYLRAQGGRVFDEQPLAIKYPEAAREILRALAHKKWWWEMTHHNCLTFVHRVALAGGVSPWELGYRIDNIHADPKFPRNFSKLQNERAGQPWVEISTQMLAAYNQEATTKFAYWFKESDAVAFETKKEIAEYYATLRSYKVPKYEVIGFIAKAYKLDLSESCKHHKTMARLNDMFANVTYKVFDDLHALCGVAHCGMFGDKRPFARRDPNPITQAELAQRQNAQEEQAERPISKYAVG